MHTININLQLSGMFLQDSIFLIFFMNELIFFKKNANKIKKTYDMVLMVNFEHCYCLQQYQQVHQTTFIRINIICNDFKITIKIDEIVYIYFAFRTIRSGNMRQSFFIRKIFKYLLLKKKM